MANLYCWSYYYETSKVCHGNHDMWRDRIIPKLNHPQNGGYDKFYDMRLGMWTASRSRIGIVRKNGGKQTF